MNHRVRTIIESLLLTSFFLLPFARLKVNFFGLPLYMLEIPIVLACIVAAATLAKKQTLPRIPLFSDRLLTFGLALFILGAALSLFIHPFSLHGLGLLKSWIVFPITAAILWSTVRGRNNRLFTLWLISASGIAISALAFPPGESLTYDGRLTAWYTSPNFLAIAVAPGLLIGAHILMSLMTKRRPKLLPIIALALTITALAITLFLTHSYSAWIGTAAALIVLFSRSVLHKHRILLLALLIALMTIFASSEYGSEKWHSLTSFDERSSLASRMMIWRSATMMITDHPFSGIGIGRFQETYLSYQRFFPPYLEWAVPEPHNLILALWLNTGILGLAGFALLIGRTAWLLFRQHATRNKKASLELALSLIVLYVVYGFWDTPYFGNDLSFLFFILIAAGAGIATDRSDTADVSVDQ